MTSIVRFALYPTFFFGCVLALMYAVSLGVPYLQVGPPILLGSAILVVALERWWPHASTWQRDRGDLRTDIAHLTTNVLVSQLSVAMYAWFAGSALNLWPRHWALIAQCMLATAIVDFGLYIVHRASHGVGALWRLHAIHHSPTRVYWLNGQRRHVVHELIEGTPGLAVLFILGAPPAIYAAAIATVTLHLMWQHANIDYRVGPLRYVFAVAELHRWHHQRRWQDVQGNYGAVLSVWDYVFGTALRKAGDAPNDVGMDDEPDLPTDFVGQLAWPFTRPQHPPRVTGET